MRLLRMGQQFRLQFWTELQKQKRQPLDFSLISVQIILACLLEFNWPMGLWTRLSPVVSLFHAGNLKHTQLSLTSSQTLKSTFTLARSCTRQTTTLLASSDSLVSTKLSRVLQGFRSLSTSIQCVSWQSRLTKPFQGKQRLWLFHQAHFLSNLTS